MRQSNNNGKDANSATRRVNALGLAGPGELLELLDAALHGGASPKQRIIEITKAPSVVVSVNKASTRSVHVFLESKKEATTAS